MGSLRGREDGAVAVEFALVLPLLLLLTTGIIEFSRAYNAKEALQFAVREGARELAIHNDPATAAAITASRAVALDPSAVSVSVGAACPDDPAPSDAAVVTATYQLPYAIPFFSAGTWSLSATGVMRCNG